MNSSYPNASKGLKWLFIAQILAIISIPLLLILIGGITAIIALVLELVALYTASHDDEGYKTAFYASIASLVVNVISNFVGDGILGALVSIVSSVISLFIVYQVCTVTGNLLTGRDEALAQRGATVVKIYLVCTVVDIVCSIVGLIPVLNILAGLVSIVSAIAILVGYIMYLIFIYKSSKVLA